MSGGVHLLQASDRDMRVDLGRQICVTEQGPDDWDVWTYLPIAGS
jgi:hypothetical protein